MRCTNCGLPLSPAIINGTCPRCYAVIGSGTGQTGRNPTASATTPSSPYLFEAQRGLGRGANTGTGIGMGQPHSQGDREYMPWPSDTPSPTPMFPQSAQSTPLPGQPWYPAQGTSQTPARHQCRRRYPHQPGCHHPPIPEISGVER